MSSRAKTLGLHSWSKEDTVLSLYLMKFGTKGLYLKTESDVAKFIGTSVGSLKMQCANLRELSGEKGRTLTDYSKLQEEVFEEYNGMRQYELMTKVREIIHQDDYERAEILRKMGKDPQKMRKIN